MSDRIVIIGSNKEKSLLLPTFDRILIGCFISELQWIEIWFVSRRFLDLVWARTAHDPKDEVDPSAWVETFSENRRLLEAMPTVSMHSNHQGVARPCEMTELTLSYPLVACYPTAVVPSRRTLRRARAENRREKVRFRRSVAPK